MVKTFEEVYREHVRFVWRSVRRLGVEERNVEDVVQLVRSSLPGRSPIAGAGPA